MKRCYGFNLIELMISLAISACVVAAVTSLNADLYASFLFTSNKIQLQQSLRFAMLIMKKDLQNAGVFGSFSFHNQAAMNESGTKVNYEEINLAANNNLMSDFASKYSLMKAKFDAEKASVCSQNDWCKFQNVGVGVHSYIPGSLIAGTGINAKSDILRIQFGGDKIAYFTEAKLTNQVISELSFIVPVGSSTTAKTYMLAAANHAYLLNSATALANLQIKGLNINIESAVNDILYDPDQASLVLAPFVTKYYFVDAAGLQVISYDGTSLAQSTLISDQIIGLAVSYKVDNIPLTNFNHYGAGNIYTWCSTAAMNDIKNKLCFNKWAQISVINITLTGRSKQTAGVPSTSLTQTESDSVGWLW